MKVVETEAMRQSREAFHKEEIARFTAGKISIRWSQARAGMAIYVAGKPHGDTYMTADDAKNFLTELGIDIDAHNSSCK